MNWGFIIDNRKCIGCHACTVACKAEHDIPLGVNRTWVKYIEKGEFPNTRRIFSVMRCNHCADAPCVDICPTSALFTRADGIVDFDNRRCIGCRACMQACPYDALYLDPETNTAAKCNYCAHRVEIGLEPACVNVCPEHAIISGDMDNPSSEITQLLFREQVTARKVEKGTQPKLYYIEGDEVSLKSSLTEQSNEYFWSSQSSGVGHFAKYAEERLSQNTKNSGHETGTWLESDSNQVLVPSPAMQDKARDVAKESATRVYDAPYKGVIWGWQVSAYIWTKSIATGTFLVVFLAMMFGFAEVRDFLQWFSLSTGLIFLGLTTWLLVKDLDQAKRFVYVLLRPQWKSWLVKGGYAIAIYGGLLTVWGIAKLLDRQLFLTPVLWGCAISAFITAIYTAFLFAQAKGRDFWQSPMLSLHMLMHSILAGTGMLALFSFFNKMGFAWLTYLEIMMLSAIAVNLFIITIELTTSHPTADSKKVVDMITGGQFSRLFWLGSLLMGNIIPATLALTGLAPLLAFAGAFLLIGIYITEHIWVRAPQLIPLS